MSYNDAKMPSSHWQLKKIYVVGGGEPYIEQTSVTVTAAHKATEIKPRLRPAELAP